MRGGGNSRLVIVNDGSKDDTYEILKSQQESHPLLVALDKPNGGHGPALIFGYRYALNKGASYIFQTDSDGQTDPAEFEGFWQKRGSYDALFGNRTNRGDGQDRAFVERVLCGVLKHYFRVDVPDSNAPFRLMSSSYVARYLPRMRADYNLPNVMLVTFGAYYSESIDFIPISFAPRQGGKNSINVRRIIRIGLDALGDFRAFRRAM